MDEACCIQYTLASTIVCMTHRAKLYLLLEFCVAFNIVVGLVCAVFYCCLINLNCVILSHLEYNAYGSNGCALQLSLSLSHSLCIKIKWCFQFGVVVFVCSWQMPANWLLSIYRILYSTRGACVSMIIYRQPWNWKHPLNGAYQQIKSTCSEFEYIGYLKPKLR